MNLLEISNILIVSAIITLLVIFVASKIDQDWENFLKEGKQFCISNGYGFDYSGIAAYCLKDGEAHQLIKSHGQFYILK